MTHPISDNPEIQRRINRAKELFQLQTEDEIFWMRYQAACTAAAKERRGENDSMRSENEGLEIIKK